VVRTSELRTKDVVNLADGRRLGFISDLELDLETGRVVAIVVPGPGRIFGLFGRDHDIVIGWPQVKKIGVDTILVELSAERGGHP
jgi:YlmC/YmxH family sporulation protein